MKTLSKILLEMQFKHSSVCVSINLDLADTLKGKFGTGGGGRRG